jgi:hypothetical protein
MPSVCSQPHRISITDPCHGSIVQHPKPTEAITASPEKDNLLTCRPDGLTAWQAEYCKTGVADRPLCRLVFRRRDYEMYRAANTRFAGAVARHVVWVWMCTLS